MIDLFAIKLILSFIIGSIWITLLSIFSEKLGTKIGGAIAGIPATMAVALFFIGWTQSPQIASDSTTVVPFVVGINALFVIIFILLYRFGFYLSLLGSLAFWFMASFILAASGFDNLTCSIIGYMMSVGLSYYFLENKLGIKSIGKKKIRYTPGQILFRGAISGLIIISAVFAAKTSGPLVGGIFASFPALTVAMIIITHIDHDISFTMAFLKNFIIAGTINVVIFAIAIRYSYLFVGLVFGTIISMLISFLSAYLTYQFINKKMS